MEVTLELIFSLVVFCIGLKIICVGRIDIEFGITNGAESNSKFIASKKDTLSGNSARLVGLFISLSGVLLYFFLENGETLFVL